MNNQNYHYDGMGYQTANFNQSSNNLYQRPLNYYQNQNQGSYYNRQSQERSDYIPIEKSWTEWYPEQIVDYKPIEKKSLNYLEIKHQTDYIPIPRLEKHIEYIAVERYEEKIDYVPVERSYVVGQSPTQEISNYSPYLQNQNRNSYQGGYQYNQSNLGGYNQYQNPYSFNYNNNQRPNSNYYNQRPKYTPYQAPNGPQNSLYNNNAREPVKNPYQSPNANQRLSAYPDTVKRNPYY